MKRAVTHLRSLPRLDLAIAGALTLLAVLAAVTEDRSFPDGLVLLAASVLMTAPLAWRRSHPVSVVLIVAGALAGSALLTEAPESAPTLLAQLVAVYSVAAHAATNVALACALVSCGAITVAISTDPSDNLENVPPTLLLFVAMPLAFGMVARNRERSTAELRQRAAALEAERDETAKEAAAQERARIARELHDVVSHGMSMIAVQADAAEAALETKPELAGPPIAAVRQAARDSLTDMRGMLGMLRESEDAAAQTSHGVDDVPALVERVRAAGLAVDLKIDGQAHPLSAQAELTAYRVVQEALTNAVKHAPRTRTEVLLAYTDDGLTIEVHDNGGGASDARGGGHGLVGMKERVELLGGTLVAEPSGDGGFCVTATFSDAGSAP